MRASVVKQIEVAKQRIKRIKRGAQDVVKNGKDVGKETDGIIEEVGTRQIIGFGKEASVVLAWQQKVLLFSGWQ
eukprot:10642828-Ditylum_brightwellii.AAC.1